MWNNEESRSFILSKVSDSSIVNGENIYGVLRLTRLERKLVGSDWNFEYRLIYYIEDKN